MSFLQDSREGFNALVVASKKLRSLHLSSGLHFKATFGKVPLIRQLIAEEWPYTAQEVEDIWDFSEVRQLSLGPISDTIGFMSSVKPTMFPVLRELRIWENIDYLEAQQKISSAKLPAFISHLGPLETLDVTTYDPIAVVKLLAKHQQSLTCLGIYEMHSCISPIGMRDVKSIVEACPNLIEFNLRARVPGIPDQNYNGDFAQAVCGLHNIPEIENYLANWCLNVAIHHG